MRRTSIIIFVVAVAAAFAAHALTPARALSDTLPTLVLSEAIPTEIGDWHVDEHAAAAVVNPQQAATIAAIYSQTLVRTYVNRDGQRIMLSIAYGKNQRDDLQVHKPELCYPAQGFVVMSVRRSTLETPLGDLPVKRVKTRMGEERFEPVTYWMTVGDHVVLGGLDKKRAEMGYGLKGLYPDGLLFRVSTIDRNSERAFVLEDEFIKAVLTDVGASTRVRLVGRLHNAAGAVARN